MIQPRHEYKGYVYDPVDDVEPEENIKIFHDVITPDGKRIHIDWTPYGTPCAAAFALWVDLGCPGRILSKDGRSSYNMSCLADLEGIRDGRLKAASSLIDEQEDERERYKEFLNRDGDA